MKILKTLSFVALIFLFTKVDAQNDIPKGYNKGTLVLPGNSILNGYIKDNMKKDASVSFMNGTSDKKIKYNANDLISLEIDATKFTCIKGDFFKVICNGELCFLQKSSDASGTITYNGSEAIYATGTPGKPGDYFIFSSKDQQLQLVSNKTFETVTAEVFAGYAPAIEKSKTAKDNIASLSEAVVIYNNR